MHIKRTEHAYKQTSTRRAHTFTPPNMSSTHKPANRIPVSFTVQALLIRERTHSHSHTLYLGLRSSKLPGWAMNSTYFHTLHTLYSCDQTLCVFCFWVCVTFTHTLTKAFSGTHTHTYQCTAVYESVYLIEHNWKVCDFIRLVVLYIYMYT